MLSQCLITGLLSTPFIYKYMHARASTKYFMQSSKFDPLKNINICVGTLQGTPFKSIQNGDIVFRKLNLYKETRIQNDSVLGLILLCSIFSRNDDEYSYVSEHVDTLMQGSPDLQFSGMKIDTNNIIDAYIDHKSELSNFHLENISTMFENYKGIRQIMFYSKLEESVIKNNDKVYIFTDTVRFQPKIIICDMNSHKLLEKYIATKYYKKMNELILILIIIIIYIVSGIIIFLTSPLD